MEHAPIAVVGAGLIGATAALAAARRYPGSEIRWLDRGLMRPPPTRSDFDARVIACTPGSQGFLGELGVWGHILPGSFQNYDRMHVWDARGGGAITFAASDIGESRLGSIVEVSELLRALHVEIVHQTNIHLCPETEVIGLGQLGDQHRVLELAGGGNLECQLIIGADGSQSRLRELAGIKARVRAMGQEALVAVVQHERPHSETAWQAFHAEGPLAFLPLPPGESGRHQSAIVWSLDEAVAGPRLELADGAFADLLENAIGGRLGRILTVGKRAHFPLHQLHARHYCQMGLCLIGDAAHRLHPLAGQGANQGFRDVRALDREMARAVKRDISPGDFSVLRRYERARKAENLAMLASMEAFRYGFGSSSVLVGRLRNMAMRRVDNWRALKARFARQAML